MIWKPSQVLEGGIPPYSCSHEETDPRDALPVSMPQGMTAPGYMLTDSATVSDNMVLHGVLRQTNVKSWCKRRRRRKCECVTRIGNN